MKPLRLEKVYVKRLFDRFTYDIDLNNGNDVAILIAPNGCGKTTIFKLISFILAPTYQRYREISNVPFEEFQCLLSNGKTIVLTSRRINEKKTRVERLGKYVSFSYDEYLAVESEEEQISEEIILSIIDSQTITDKHPTINVTKEFNRPVTERNSGSWDDVTEYPIIGGIRTKKQEVENYSMAGIVAFLKKYECVIPINFISADRLHTNPLKSRKRYGVEERDCNPIEEAQRHTSSIYYRAVERYNNLQTMVKDKLPKQYLEVDKPTMEYNEFEMRWIQYVTDVKKYHEIGLLDSAETILETHELRKAYDEKGAFLTVYLSAFEETLKPLAEEYDRMKLLADILNKRNAVTHKEIKFGKRGITVCVDNKDVPLQYLSSGEKHDLIMFYNLIYNSKVGGLVLIDEPEISLHIEWQEQYLDCLLEICKINNLQAVVATHSPNIVNGHVELFAERGLQDEC